MKKTFLILLIISIFSINSVYADAVREKLLSLGFHIIDKNTNYIDFSLNSLEGRKINLKDYVGKVVFINFWATWCPPCVAEMPSMENLYQEMKGLDFEMLAVNIQESAPVVQRFVDARKLTFPVLLDSNAAAASSYSVRSIPTTFVIDKNGKIAGLFVGAKDWDSDSSVKVFKEISR